jgi:hypothetical protein
MDNDTQIQKLNTAWMNKEIDFRRQQVKSSIKSASFDGLVYLTLSEGLYCAYLDIGKPNVRPCVPRRTLSRDESIVLESQIFS